MLLTSEIRYRTGKYVVDLGTRRLLLDGAAVDLPWRCFEALALLVEAGGAIVDREALFRKLWPGVEVEESSLTKVLSQLRRTLAAGDPSAEYIETVPRLGYRLSVPTRLEHITNGFPIATPLAKPARTNRKALWVLAGIMVLGALGVAGMWGWRRQQRLAEADAYYQEGRRLNRQSDQASIRNAIEALRRATELNPTNAIYYATLARALGRVSSSEPINGSPMREAGERSVQLDPSCAGCQATLGFILFSRFWEWEKAGAHLNQALRLAPNDYGLRGYLAMYLPSQGKTAEALAHLDEAIRIAPYAVRSYQLKTVALCLLGRYPEAIDASDRAISIDPDDRATWDWRAHSLFLAGREREALSATLELGWKEHASKVDQLYRAKGLAGALGLLLELTGDSKSRSGHSYRRAQWKMHLGDRDGALEELEAALKFRHFNLIYVAADPVFSPVHADPRFQAILRSMALPAGKPTASPSSTARRHAASLPATSRSRPARAA